MFLRCRLAIEPVPISKILFFIIKLSLILKLFLYSKFKHFLCKFYPILLISRHNVKIFLDSYYLPFVIAKTFLILSIYYINKPNVQILNNILTDNN